jgi:thioredoxin-dependent peroxiredoxin
MALRVGQKAPDFDVRTSDGRSLKLADFRDKKNVVLYFYPADFTLVCTKETCGFRDAYDELQGKDTEVVGVSVDSDASHKKFALEHNVPFPLVADENMALAKTYEATSFLRNLLKKTSRITYVIDKKGDIAGVFQSELSAGHHVDGVRELVKKLG